jgi:probable F420-dependent oxidoreductase
MKIDAGTLSSNLREVSALAREAEEIGFDGLWTSETQHDPFLPLALAAEHTTLLELGTAIAVAFPRSPTVIAHIAWDLAAQSKGRFMLGLGTQVKAHIERRFGMTWDSPAPKLREMILAMRALWQAWQGDGRINFRGQFYKITLMTPFFNPGPIEHPNIPIFIAGVNEKLCQLAGELCQGFHVHPFHTAKYVREVTLPNIEKGLKQSRRTRADIGLSSAVFTATNQAEKEAARAQISFYASTPSYRPVLQIHGWGATGDRLSAMASRGRWAEMPQQITDEMLNEVAILAEGDDELAGRIKERYSGLLDRVTLYRSFEPGGDRERWEKLVDAFKSSN